MRLRVLTWNLAGLHDELLDERTEAACLAMLFRTPQPDVVLLQEVVRRSWHGHVRHHFAAAGFTPVPADPTTIETESFVVAFLGPRLAEARGASARLPATRMGRHLVTVDARCDGIPFRVMTAHLDSLREGRRERLVQMAEIVRLLRAAGGPALFAGDTNLRDAEVAVLDLGGVTDAWEAAGSAEATRWTWRLPQGTARARFDRVYLRGLSVSSFGFVGDRPFGEGREPPSDHVGVEVVVERA
jgi:endonuclease/exonuclease/phosphatase family metal-dependent hydrolase